MSDETFEPSHNYLNAERCPQSLGDAMRLVGRYTESEGGNSPETRQARADLFDAYETWCQLDRPETEAPPLTDGQRSKFEAAVARALAARGSSPEPLLPQPDDDEPTDVVACPTCGGTGCGHEGEDDGTCPIACPRCHGAAVLPRSEVHYESNLYWSHYTPAAAPEWAELVEAHRWERKAEPGSEHMEAAEAVCGAVDALIESLAASPSPVAESEEGRDEKPTAPNVDPTADLMAALRQSVAEAKARHEIGCELCGLGRSFAVHSDQQAKGYHDFVLGGAPL